MAKEVIAGVYARVSTDDKGQDPETQLGLLREYCQSRHWPYKVYIDRASGGDTNREALKQLRHDVAWHRINTVVIFKFDRLARNLKELIDIVDDWNRRRINLISLTENVDTTSAQGRLVFSIFGAVAEFERGLISERVRAGMARAKREGKQLGRPKTRVRIATDIVEGLKQGTISLYGAAKATGIPQSTLRRRLIERGVTICQKGSTGVQAG